MRKIIQTIRPNWIRSPPAYSSSREQEKTSSSNNYRFLSCAKPCLARPVNVVETKAVFGRKLVIIDNVVCERVNTHARRKELDTVTIFDVRRLLERRNLEKSKPILGKLFIRYAQS